MLKSLIVVISLVMSGMVHADYSDYKMDNQDQQVVTADAGDVLGGLLLIGIIGKLIKDKKKKDKKKKKPDPKPEPITERVRIPMHGEVAKGSNTIYLRSELDDMGVDLDGARVRRVILVAKSKKGHGTATLQLGKKMKPTKDVLAAQNGYGFKTNARESYNRISWNANRTSDDLWQIHLQGRIKVKAVIVELEY